MTPLPTLSEEERKRNLEKAMKARREQAQLLKAVKEAEVSPDAALCDPIMRKCPVKRFLKAIPGFGDAKTNAVMKMVGIKENRRVRGLGSRQLEALLDVIANEQQRMTPSRLTSRPGRLNERGA